MTYLAFRHLLSMRIQSIKFILSNHSNIVFTLVKYTRSRKKSLHRKAVFCWKHVQEFPIWCSENYFEMRFFYYGVLPMTLQLAIRATSKSRLTLNVDLVIHFHFVSRVPTVCCQSRLLLICARVTFPV